MMMSERKSDPASLSTRVRVLAAAERLLAEGAAEFSMRDLAAAAGVSFATPFNQFGSKLAIMRALSSRRIETMQARFAAAPRSREAVQRVLAAVEIAVAVMLEAPAVNRAVMASIGGAGAEPGDVRERSRALWAEALADGEGLAPASRTLACAVLPEQLAIGFRGVLSFWTAGEIGDAELPVSARAVAAALLFGFAGDTRRDELATLMQAAIR